jgi:hypothetical protein
LGAPFVTPVGRTCVRTCDRPRFSESELRDAISRSKSWAETLRRLQYRSAGGNWKTLKKYAALWDIDRSHFDPDAARNAVLARNFFVATPLDRILVRNSTYNRAHLKERLFREGLKARRCEFCGQGEVWRGARMALILDHINGIPNDHRLENLRILCPNCAATLKTHCGRKNRSRDRTCDGCGAEFVAKYRRHRFCSRACGAKYGRHTAARLRKVERPPYEQLMHEIARLGYRGTGRKYRVSDNAIRKWVRFYENEFEREGVRTGLRGLPDS